MKQCERCGKEHDGNYGSGRFCSLKCRASYAGLKADRKKQSESAKKSGTIFKLIEFNKKREDEKRRIKELERLSKEHFCERCGKRHDGLFGSGIYCSSFCSHKREWSVEKRKKQSEIAKKSKKVLSANKKKVKKRITKKCLVCQNEMLLYAYEASKKFCSKKMYVGRIKIGNI